MENSKNINFSPVKWKLYVWSTAVVWTMIIAVSLLWSIVQIKQSMLKVAYIQARTAFERDIIYRRWSAGHGGVYVPVTKETPPNPYLSHILDRDITTPSGVLLTLINPAYMSRQVYELSETALGIRGHITSLNSIRSQNFPDPWETEALKVFEKGQTEINSIEKIDNKDFIRFMKALITEEACLKCHASQGYQVGDIRGGISISIPLDSIKTVAQAQRFPFIIGHVFIWIVGLGGIFLAMTRLDKNERQRRTVEETLIQQEEELENIFNLSPDMVAVFTTEGRLLKVNPSWKKVLGYTQKELLGMNWTKLVHPDDVDKTNKEVEKQLKGSSVVNFVNRYKCKDGSFKTLEWQASFSQEGIVHATARDITERKKAEEKLEISQKKLHKLAAHLQTVREEERTLVAHELHDEIGQALSALKMDIFMLEKKLPKDQKDIAEQLKKTNDLLDQTIETTRKIYSELRPTLLEHFSIKEVLEDQLNNFKKSNNLSGDADIDLEGIELEEKDAISLFRIVQEALNNVKWHSQAKTVKIRLKKKKNQLELIIADNGIGIKEDDLVKSNSYGIFGMKERANFLGGEIDFKGIPEKGTTITVTIPIKQINLETNRSRD